LKLCSRFALLQTGSQEKASAEALAGHARRLALNVVFAQVCWAFRFALAESWGLASQRFPVAEEPGAERSVVTAVRVAARFANATATGKRTGQRAHQTTAVRLGARSARGARSPGAAGSTDANSAVGRTFSPSGCRMAGLSSSGYCSAGDSRSPYAPC